MHARRTLATSALVLFFRITCAFAQRADGPGDQVARIPEVQFEATVIAGADSGRDLAVVMYRINERFFAFVRGQSAQGLEQYEARGELSVEIQTTEKTSVARALLPISVIRAFQPREGEDLPDLQGLLSFPLQAGTYHAVVEVRDQESSRSSTNRSLPLQHGESSGTLTISPPILTEPPTTDSLGRTEFVPVNRGGILPFGGQAGGVLVPVSPAHSGDPVTVHWNLEGRSDDELFAPLQLRDSVVAMARGAVVPRPGSPAAFTLLPSGGKSAALYVPLPAKRLTPGQYTLTLSVAIGSVRGEQKSHFDVIWPLRPLSLTRFDLAVDALQHIMAPAEFDEIKGESSAKAEEHLRRFWQSRNPDSTRAYNPVMLEYYRRVDEAVRRFSVRNEPNGQKSDRGRILILFGPPSRTDRSLKSGSGTIEVWTYDRLRKRFTFSDPDHSGVYVLIRSEDL